MRSIKARFNQFKKEGVGDFVILYRAVKNQNFTKENISQNFKELINEEGYDLKDIHKLINQLFQASNMPEERKNEVNLPRKD